MNLDPQVPPSHTSDPTSFAYLSAKDRWPVIITGAIDDVFKATSAATDDTSRAEGKTIVESLATLKYELQHDRKLAPLMDDGEPDVESYNSELAQLGEPTWFNVPWLFAECYLYRRIASFFRLSTKWKNYDVFLKQKLSTFKSSRAAVLELASRYRDLVNQLESQTKKDKLIKEGADAEYIIFREMCEICLWGNATDLSLLTNLSYDDIQKLQGAKARKENEAKILVNDFQAAFDSMKEAQKERPTEERRVDIVLDNAGFELFVDLILAGYLIAAGLSTNIVLHPKSIPWFVSDVIPADFAILLNALADPQAFYTSLSEDEATESQERPKYAEPLSSDEVDNIDFLFQHWSELHSEGKLAIRPNRFWTNGGSYWRMPTTNPELFEDLRHSELVVFKGDLNYRKLVGDKNWSPTTPFREALGPLAKPGQGLRLLALRTSKADVVVGLPEGEDERLRNTEGGGGDSGSRKWAWSGKWALVQFSDGKSS